MRSKKEEKKKKTGGETKDRKPNNPVSQEFIFCRVRLCDFLFDPGFVQSINVSEC